MFFVFLGKVLIGRIFIFSGIWFVVVLDVLVNFFVVYGNVFWSGDIDMDLVVFDVEYGYVD